MNLIAIIPSGATELTVNGLHQWDYGRKLEIHSLELPALVEVHFACVGMKDAVVRNCSVINGVATATIPDICLEQTSPVYAWVYIVSESAGATAKTIILPITARTRPQLEASIPRDNSDAYTRFVAEIQALIDSINSGELKLDHALTADRAETAETADSAVSVKTVAVASLEELEALCAAKMSCPVTLSADIGILGQTFPRYAKGWLATASDATISVIDTAGKVYTAYRASDGVWQGARVSSRADTCNLADNARSSESLTLVKGSATNRITKAGVYVITGYEPTRPHASRVFLLCVDDLSKGSISTTFRYDLGSLPDDDLYVEYSPLDSGTQGTIAVLNWKAGEVIDNLFVITHCICIGKF